MLCPPQNRSSVLIQRQIAQSIAMFALGVCIEKVDRKPNINHTPIAYWATHVLVNIGLSSGGKLCAIVNCSSGHNGVGQ